MGGMLDGAVYRRPLWAVKFCLVKTRAVGFERRTLFTVLLLCFLVFFFLIHLERNAPAAHTRKNGCDTSGLVVLFSGKIVGWTLKEIHICSWVAWKCEVCLSVFRMWRPTKPSRRHGHRPQCRLWWGYAGDKDDVAGCVIKED